MTLDWKIGRGFKRHLHASMSDWIRPLVFRPNPVCPMNSLRVIACTLLVCLAQSGLAAAPRVGVLLRDKDWFYAEVEKGATEAAAQAGAELVVKAPLIANALNQQMAFLAALEKEPLDALVISPLTVDEFKEPLARFRAKGVKIVLVETVMPDGTADTYLGYNQKDMAEAAARLFAPLVQGANEVAMLRANSLERVSMREKTFLAVLHDLQPAVTIHADVMAGSTKGDDFEKLGVLFERHPDVKAICTPFTASTMAMVKFSRERSLSGKVAHLGFGSGLPAEVAESIESGATAVYIAQLPRQFGVRGVQAALDLVAGKAVPATIDVDYLVVTQANLQSPEVQALRR